LDHIVVTTSFFISCGAYGYFVSGHKPFFFVLCSFIVSVVSVELLFIYFAISDSVLLYSHFDLHLAHAFVLFWHKFTQNENAPVFRWLVVLHFTLSEYFVTCCVVVGGCVLFEEWGACLFPEDVEH
jgi:hypothetical protein